MKFLESVRRRINKNRFSVVVSFVVVLAGITVFFFSYMIVTKAEEVVVEGFSEEGLNMVKGASRRVSHLFHGVSSELEQLAQFKEIQISHNVQPSGVMEVTYRGMKEHISCLQRFDGEGDIIAGYRDDGELIVEAPNEFNRDCFQKAMHEKEPVMSEVFINDKGFRTIRITYPIYRYREEGGKGRVFDGVLAADIKVDEIYPLMVKPFGGFKEDRIQFILYSSNGEVISYPSHNQIKGKNLFDDRENCRGCHALSEEFLSLTRAGVGWKVIDSFYDKKVVAVYEPIELMDRRWVVGLYADYDHVVREARVISKYAIIVAAFSIMILAVGFISALTLLKLRKKTEQQQRALERERELVRKVKESEERFRDLFEGVKSGVYVSTPEGRFREANDALVNILGYDNKEELFGIDIRADLFLDSQERIRFMDEVEKNGVVKDFECHYKKKSGDLVICLETTYGKRDESGKIVEYLGVMVDITRRKEMEREIRGKNDQLNTLHEVSKIINRSLDIKDILDLSLEKTLEVTPFDAGGIYLYDEEKQILELQGSVGVPNAVLDQLKSVRMGETLTGEIARSKKMIVLDALSEDSRSLTARAGLNFRAYAGLPLLYGDRLMGVIHLASYRELRREEYMIEFLEGLGELIGIAIGNAGLYGDSQRRAMEMQVLYEAGKSFMAITDMQQLAKKVVEVANSELGYHACTLFHFDEEKRELSILSTSSVKKEEMQKKNIRVYSDGVISWVAENKELCYLPDVEKDPRYQPGWLETGSELAIPLRVGEKVLGVIDFEKQETHGFDPDGIRYLSLYANQVAWALYNVELFEEIRKANDDLNRVSELKTQFVSLVSHELRTPMTAIKGALDIIQSGATGLLSADQQKFLSMARRNILRLSDMINNILDLSRIEAGKIAFDFTEIDLQEPLQQVMLTLSNTAREEDIALESQLPSDLPSLYADEAKIEQVLMNLIANALKSTPSGGKVTVLAGMAQKKDMEKIPPMKVDRLCPENYIKVSVVDTGLGIPLDQLETVFDRYQQLKGRKGNRGSGLGLAICRYLVEGHGGAIWAERKRGRGGVFNFLLPIYHSYAEKRKGGP